MLQNYELYIILNPNLNSDDLNTEITNVETVLKDEVGALNLTISQEGLRKLAYPINHAKTGFYVMINFDLELGSCKNVHLVEAKMNLRDNLIRYIIINQTEHNAQTAKQELRAEDTAIKSHRDLNKGKVKQCFLKYMGYRSVDYKDLGLIAPFVSPYGKMFDREKTGTSAKFQRKIAMAIKRSRHMALLPFTNIHN